MGSHTMTAWVIKEKHVREDEAARYEMMVNILFHDTLIKIAIKIATLVCEAIAIAKDDMN